jgi:hypothetical protein
MGCARMSVDLEVPIRKKEAKLQSLLPRMEELRLQFIDLTTRFVWNILNKKHENTLRKNPKSLARDAE